MGYLYGGLAVPLEFGRRCIVIGKPVKQQLARRTFTNPMVTTTSHPTRTQEPKCTCFQVSTVADTARFVETSEPNLFRPTRIRLLRFVCLLIQAVLAPPAPKWQLKL